VQRLLLLKKPEFGLVSGGIHNLCVRSFEASLPEHISTMTLGGYHDTLFFSQFMLL
jgi:hypothetical protein